MAPAAITLLRAVICAIFASSDSSPLFVDSAGFLCHQDFSLRFDRSILQEDITTHVK